MNTYHFSLILSGAIELTEQIADALFAAGCEDGTPGTSNGVFVIDFSRAAPSLEQAIQSAIADVRTAGHDVARVEMDPGALAESA